MLFSCNWLQSFFKTRIPEPKKLAKLLTMHSFEVEELKKVESDWTLDIDIMPNRPDCFSHLGIAREISAITGLKLQPLAIKIKQEKEKIQKFAQIEIKDKACKRYAGKILLDIKVNVSPKYIQERLMACGLEPINNIVDAANYVMLETGQPLHIFDFDKIKNVNSKSKTLNSKQFLNPKFKTLNKIKKIVVRKAKKGEEIDALDNKKYKLDENILVIADSEKSLAIAGIKGGKLAAIDSNTKNIFLESANFDGACIRKASQELKLKTDASFRFEHNIDPNLAEFAIDRLVYLIQETAGGKALEGKLDFYLGKPKTKKIILFLDYANQLLGTNISLKKALATLNSLEIKAIKKQGQKIEAKIPSHRQDLVFAEDLIEEIGRIYGYENILPLFPISVLVPTEKNQEIAWENKIKDILKEANFTETYNYSFIPKKTGDYFNWQLLGLENPYSKEFYYLRPSLIFNILTNIKKNLKHFSAFKIRLFEIGKTFKKQEGEIIEKKYLAGAVSGEKQGFFLLKGLIDFLLHSLGISDIYYDEFEATSEQSPQVVWDSFESAEVKANGQEIGFLGKISEQFLEKTGIKESVFCFEINLDLLIKFCQEKTEYFPVSKYPAAVRDIAILVPLEIKAGEVMEKIHKSGGNLIQDIDLFDIYEGETLPQGKKNLAFHIIFQSQEKTLSKEEIDQIQNNIISGLEKMPEWEVRRGLTTNN